MTGRPTKRQLQQEIKRSVKRRLHVQGQSTTISSVGRDGKSTIILDKNPKLFSKPVEPQSDSDTETCEKKITKEIVDDLDTSIEKGKREQTQASKIS